MKVIKILSGLMLQNNVTWNRYCFGFHENSFLRLLKQEKQIHPLIQIIDLNFINDHRTTEMIISRVFHIC